MRAKLYFTLLIPGSTEWVKLFISVLAYVMLLNAEGPIQMNHAIDQFSCAAGEEKRKDPRFVIEAKITYRAQGRLNAPGYVRDISQSGIFLVTMERLQLSTPLLFYFNFEIRNRERTCMLSGKTVRMVQGTEKPIFGYGIHFEFNSKGTLDTVNRYLNERTKMAKAKSANNH